MKSRIGRIIGTLTVLLLAATIGCVQQSDRGDKEKSEEEGAEPQAVAPDTAKESACVQECRSICGEDANVEATKLETHFRNKLREQLAERKRPATAKRDARPARPVVAAAPNPLKNLPFKGAKDPKVVILESSDFQ